MYTKVCVIGCVKRRRYFDDKQFLDVDTPMLNRSTPEVAIPFNRLTYQESMDVLRKY